MIRPGVTPDEVAQVWPDATEFGYRDEAEAFLLQYGHGVGLSLWERPIISKRYRGQNQPLREGMVFALEKIGRASCRERVCQYVYISVVAVAFKKKTKNYIKNKKI